MYFWFSQKQFRASVRTDNGKYNPLYVESEDGWKQYTEATETAKPSGNWDDYQLVHSSIGKSNCKSSKGPYFKQ